MSNPFRYFKTSPEIIRLAVMMYIRFPLSLRQVEDLLHERGIDITYETVRAWWNRFGPIFAAQIRKTRSASLRGSTQWRWHLDEVFVRINGETHYLWRAVDHEGEILETFVTKRRNRKAALRFLKRAMKRYGNPQEVVTDRLRSYHAAMKEIGNDARQTTGRWLNNRAEDLPPTVPTTRASDGQILRRPSRYRNSPQYTRHCITTSIKNAIFTAVKPSSSIVPLRSRSGDSLRPEIYRGRVLQITLLLSDNTRPAMLNNSWRYTRWSVISSGSVDI